MTDTALSHYGDRNCVLDTLYHCGVAHSCNTACGTDICGDTLKRHYRTSACLLRYSRLLGSCNVHYYSAL